MKLKYYSKTTLKMVISFIIMALIISACEYTVEKKHLSMDEKSLLAVQLVDSVLLESYAEKDMPIFLRNQDIHFVEKFHDSLIEIQKRDLLFYKTNKDSLIDIYGKDVIESNINYIKEGLKFYKSFCGFEIRKHFHVAEEKTPRAMQLFFVDTSLVLRAVSKGWFTKMHIDTIDDEEKRYYVDTVEHFYYENFWND